MWKKFQPGSEEWKSPKFNFDAFSHNHGIKPIWKLPPLFGLILDMFLDSTLSLSSGVLLSEMRL
jgi:hypothetical protein